MPLAPRLDTCNPPLQLLYTRHLVVRHSMARSRDGRATARSHGHAGAPQAPDARGQQEQHHANPDHHDGEDTGRRPSAGDVTVGGLYRACAAATRSTRRNPLGDGVAVDFDERQEDALRDEPVKEA
jgi:hypothetical protein